MNEEAMAHWGLSRQGGGDIGVVMVAYTNFLKILLCYVFLLWMTLRLAISFYSHEEGNLYFRIVIVCCIVTMEKYR